MYRFSHYLGLAGLIVIALSTDAFSQGNSVGINTATPNPNAVLQLVSPDNNQGLLIPRLTTSQRLAMQLQASEKGLMVFDDTEGLFYYWNGSAWNKLLVSQNLQTLSLDGSLLKVSGANEVDLVGIDTDKQNLTFEGTNLSIDRGNTVDLSTLINTNDADPENELQSLEFSGGELKLTNDPTSAVVDLSNYDTDVTDDFDGDYKSLTNLPTLFSGDFGDLGNVPVNLDTDATDDFDGDYNSLTNLPALFSGDFGDLGNVPGDLADGDDVDDADNSITNELQTLSLSGSDITLSNSGGTVSINDADFSTTNEIQDVSISGNAVAISGGGTGFNLAAAAPSSGQVLKYNGTNWTSAADNVDDADNSTSNELQTLSLSGSDITLSNSGGTVSINDADFSTTNEIQDLNLTSNTLTITNNGSATNIDLSPYQQTISKSGNTVSLTSGGSFALGSTAPSSVGQVLKWNGSDWGAGTDNVNDADADATNEFQTLGLSGTVLSLTGSGTTVDLAPLGVLPAQSAPLAGYYLTTNGANASWMPLGALASADDVGSAQIQDGAVNILDLNTAVAGNGLVGGGGAALDVNLAGASGLQIVSDQLQMQNVITAGTYSTLITAQIQVDAKGRVLSFSASDVRLKKDVSRIAGVLDRLVEVNGYTYHYIDQQDSVLHHGLIAQELLELFPDLAVMGANGYYSVNYQGLIPILIEALKEEHARVSDLKTEVEEMKAQLSSNDERFKTLEAKLDLLIQSTTTAKAATPSQE
ncbi:MAG: tail fiber domain-containing protein [Imperialibacter sp.]|uniref:tail fiber domain-containing protein n=1 Tax=Imperialibacter sp. TaxID=2038411 RepID=UPI0032F0693A